MKHRLIERAEQTKWGAPKPVIQETRGKEKRSTSMFFLGSGMSFSVIIEARPAAPMSGRSVDHPSLLRIFVSTSRKFRLFGTKNYALHSNSLVLISSLI